MTKGGESKGIVSRGGAHYQEVNDPRLRKGGSIEKRGQGSSAGPLNAAFEQTDMLRHFHQGDGKKKLILCDSERRGVYSCTDISRENKTIGRVYVDEVSRVVVRVESIQYLPEEPPKGEKRYSAAKQGIKTTRKRPTGALRDEKTETCTRMDYRDHSGPYREHRAPG